MERQTQHISRPRFFNFVEFGVIPVLAGLGMPALALADESPVIDADFEDGPEGFRYVDDGFRGTSQPRYAAGSHSGGSLRVSLGGINNRNIYDMSGAWQINFELPVATALRLEVDYNLTQSASYETDEYSQVLLAVDGVLVGGGGADYIDQVTGDGNGGGPRSSGWQRAVLELGTVAAGNHSLAVGGYNNKKTYWNESTTVDVDRLELVALDGGGGDDTEGGGDSGSSPALDFTIELLDRPGGFVTVPLDLNESGEAVGYYNDATLAYRAIYWDAAGVPVDLAGPGTWSQAHGISDDGRISGYYGPTLQTTQPVVWGAGGASFLNLLSGDIGGVAKDVASSGRAVGWATSNRDHVVYVWEGENPVPPSGQERGFVAEILDTHEYVGGLTLSGFPRGVYWASDGTMQVLLGADGLPSTSATGISQGGMIVGTGQAVSGSTRLLVWDSAVAVPGVLEKFEGLVGSVNDINDWGWAVGSDDRDPYNGLSNALLWDEFGAVYELGLLIPADSGFRLRDAVAVNNAGQILVAGTCACASGQIAALLTPVP